MQNKKGKKTVKLKEAPQKKPVKGFLKKITRGASK